MGRNPRGVMLSPDGKRLYVANRLDDTISVIDTRLSKVSTIDLGGPKKVDALRRGEHIFYTADFAFQGQFGCANCHLDSTIDGLQWDLEPDGFGKDIVDNRSLENLPGPSPSNGMAAIRTCRPSAARALKNSSSVRRVSLSSSSLISSRLSYAFPTAPTDTARPDGELTPAQERGKAIFERTKYKSGSRFPKAIGVRIATAARNTRTDNRSMSAPASPPIARL